MDPYQILGVSPNASDDDVKCAYRALSRKYHPDANVNNPNRDAAEEKFKQVQQAYSTIMHSRQYTTQPEEPQQWYAERSSVYQRPYADYSRLCLDLFLMNLFCGCCC